jgi:aspartyl-tRNA(Asn)/glutamyl-tRNA(Gln) amidotransferase subunit A
VGFKNTARLTPTQGCIPLSTTLDTACAITRSVRDAVLLHEVMAARRVTLDRRPLSHWRLAMPRTLMLDDLEPTVAASYGRAVEALRAAGATITEIDLPVLLDQSPGLRAGGISAAESWAWHHERLSRRGALYDPRVALRIRRGEAIGEQGLAGLLQERWAWIGRVESAVSGYDALLSPTVPIVAPRIADLADDAAFFDVNGRLLRNPAIVNLLDGCALSLPCHVAGDWPVGMMVWSCALADDRVLSVSLAIEAALAPLRGAD